VKFTGTTAVLAGALLVASMAGCAQRTTTGVPADAQTETETVNTSEEGGHNSEAGGESSAEGGASTNELSGTSWVLTGSTLTEKGADRADITAEFSDGEVSGQAPVNRYFASFEVDGETLELGTIAASLMAGPDGQMALETEFFDVLGTVDSFVLAEDTLVLRAEDVDVLEFESADIEEG
jgi:heat shock protein HslJ